MKNEGTSFGVGCFVFDVEECEDVAHWFSEVERALEEIASIDQIRIQHPEVQASGLLRLPVSNNGEPKDCFRPARGFIEFELSLPRRIQQKLSPMINPSKKLSTTVFRIKTIHHIFGPVSFIQCLDSDAGYEPEPASSVAIVREYLRKELQSIGSRVSLATVGPSPFHADFRVKVQPDSQLSGVSQIKRTPRLGYDLCTVILPDALQHENIADIAYSYLIDELDLFYHLVRQSNDRHHEVFLLREKLQNLISEHQKTGIKFLAKRMFVTSRKARDLAIEALLTESQDVKRQKTGLDHTTDLTRTTQVTFLDKLEERGHKSYADEINKIREAASILESSRARHLEVAMITTATIFGGAAGAVASLIAGR